MFCCFSNPSSPQSPAPRPAHQHHHRHRRKKHKFESASHAVARLGQDDHCPDGHAWIRVDNDETNSHGWRCACRSGLRLWATNEQLLSSSLGLYVNRRSVEAVGGRLVVPEASTMVERGYYGPYYNFRRDLVGRWRITHREMRDRLWGPSGDRVETEDGL